MIQQPVTWLQSQISIGRSPAPQRQRSQRPAFASSEPQPQTADYSFQPPLKRKRLAVFVSGGGSNLKAIHAAFQAGAIRGELSAVVSDRPGCGGWQFGESLQVPTLQFSSGDEPSELPRALEEQHGIDCVALAGFLKLVPRELVQHFPRAILNIHPGLLPAFGGKGLYGTRVHKAVIASGARYSGATVHFVDEHYDTGPILSQSVVPVRPDDTPARLAARILQTEHILLPAAIAALMDGRIAWREDGIPVLLEGR